MVSNKFAAFTAMVMSPVMFTNALYHADSTCAPYRAVQQCAPHDDLGGEGHSNRPVRPYATVLSTSTASSSG